MVEDLFCCGRADQLRGGSRDRTDSSLARHRSTQSRLTTARLCCPGITTKTVSSGSRDLAGSEAEAGVGSGGDGGGGRDRLEL